MSDGTATVERNRELVRHRVTDAINGDEVAALDDICTPRLARVLRGSFEPV